MNYSKRILQYKKHQYHSHILDECVVYAKEFGKFIGIGIVAIILLAALILILPSKADAAETKYRMYYPVTGQRFVCTQLLWQTAGTNCVITLGKSTKRMGVGQLETPTNIYDKNGDMVYQNDQIYYEPTNETLKVTYKNDDLWGTGWFLMVDETNGYGLYNNYARTLIKTGVLAVPTAMLGGSGAPSLLDTPLFIPWFQGFRTPPIWEDVRGIGWQDSRRVYIQDGDVLSKDGVNLTVLRGIYGLNDLYLYDASTINQNPTYYAIPSNYHLWIDYIKGKDKIPYENTRDFFAGWTITSSIQRI